jgi:hypothetical protein
MGAEQRGFLHTKKTLTPETDLGEVKSEVQITLRFAVKHWFLNALGVLIQHLSGTKNYSWYSSEVLD